MKKVMMMMMTAAGAALIGNPAIAENPDATYSVDTQKSQVVWTARKVTGSHTGNIALNSGNLVYSGGDLVSGEFTIDMNSMTCTDISDPASNKKLMDHLKSDDFFSVASYPESSFTIMSVKKGDDGKAHVTGELTTKGITQTIQFPAEISEENGSITAKAMAVVDRSKFNVRFGSGSFFDNLGNNLIYDNFDLEITLVTGK